MAAFQPCVRSCPAVYVSGPVPARDGWLAARGGLGAVADAAAGQAARVCALSVLARLLGTAGSLSVIARLVKIRAFVAGAPDFTSQPRVAGGASSLFPTSSAQPGRMPAPRSASTRLPLEVEAIAGLGS